MAPSLRRGAKFSRLAASQLASSEIRRTILKNKSSLKRKKRTKTVTTYQRKGVPQFAVSSESSSQKESKLAGKVSPATNSKVARNCADKPNRADRATCSKDEPRSKRRRLDQGSMTSTKQAGQHSIKPLRQPTVGQITGLKASLPNVSKVHCSESDSSDDVDDPDWTREVNDMDSESSLRVAAADSPTVGKDFPKRRDRSGRSKKVENISTQPKSKPQDVPGGHRKNDILQKTPTIKSELKMNVASTSGHATSMLVQTGRPTTTVHFKGHIMSDPLGFFREPVTIKKGSPYKCCVEGCFPATGREEVGMWLFSLPSEEEEPAVRSAWLEAIPIDVEANRPLSPRVCFRHFVAGTDFFVARHRIRGLNVDAVPSIKVPLPVAVPKNPFRHASLQTPNRTERSNTRCGGAGKPEAGSSIQSQKTQSTITASSAPESVAHGTFISGAKSTGILARPKMEMTWESLPAPSQPIVAASPSSGKMTENLNIETAEHTEAGTHTVTGRAEGKLHAAPGLEGAISPSVSLGAENEVLSPFGHTSLQTQNITERSDIGCGLTARSITDSSIQRQETQSTTTGSASRSAAHGSSVSVAKPFEIVTPPVMEITRESLPAASEPIVATSPSSGEITENPNKGTAQRSEVDTFTLTETTEKLHAAPGPKSAVTPSVSLGVGTEVLNPFGRTSLQTEDITERLNTDCGLTAKSIAGSSTQIQDTQSTMTGSASGSTAHSNSVSVAKTSEIVAPAVMEITRESLPAVSEPIAAVSPSSGNMTETPNKGTAGCTEASPLTVTGTTEEKLHAAPGPRRVTSPSVSSGAETEVLNPFGRTSSQTEDITERSNTDCGLTAKSRAGSSTQKQEMQLTMTSSTSGSAAHSNSVSVPKTSEIVAPAVMEITRESLPAASEPIAAVSPSSGNMTETANKGTAGCTEASPLTVTGMREEKLHAAPGPRGTTSPSVSLGAETEVLNPFGCTSLQTENITERLNTGCGLTAKSIAGSSTQREETQSTVATSSASGSATHGTSISAVKFTGILAHPVMETTKKGMPAASEPLVAVSPSSGKMTENLNKGTAGHTEAGPLTVAGATEEKLHATPGPKGVTCPSVSLGPETPEAVTAKSAGFGAQISVQTTMESLHAVVEAKEAGSSSGILRESPKQAEVKFTKVSAQTAAETVEMLRSAQQPEVQSSLSSNLTAQTPKEAAVRSFEDCALSSMSTAKEGLSSAPQRRDGVDTGSSSPTAMPNEAISEPTEVRACASARNVGVTLNSAQEPEGAISVGLNASSLAGTPKEALAKPIKLSAHTLPLSTAKSLSVATHSDEAIACSQGSATETNQPPDALKLAVNAHTGGQSKEEDSDVVSLSKSTNSGRTGPDLEVVGSQSSQVDCTFSTSLGLVSTEKKNLEPPSSGADEHCSDSSSDTLDCCIVEMSPASPITLSSDEEDSRMDSQPTHIDDVIEAQNSSGILSGDKQTATSSQKPASSSVSCTDLYAPASAKCSDTSSLFTPNLNSLDERSSPSCSSGLIVKKTMDTGAAGHKLILSNRHSEKTAVIQVAEPPFISSQLRDGKQNNAVPSKPQKCISGMSSSNTPNHSVHGEGRCSSTASVVQGEKTGCPPSDRRDVMNHTVAQETGAMPRRQTSVDGRRPQVAGGAISEGASAQKDLNPSVSAGIYETDRSWPQGCDEVTLFHPSQGRYVIESEIIGDDEEFGMHASSFTVDWVLIGSCPNQLHNSRKAVVAEDAVRS